MAQYALFFALFSICISLSQATRAWGAGLPYVECEELLYTAGLHENGLSRDQDLIRKIYSRSAIKVFNESLEFQQRVKKELSEYPEARMGYLSWNPESYNLLVSMAAFNPDFKNYLKDLLKNKVNLTEDFLKNEKREFKEELLGFSKEYPFAEDRNYSMYKKIFGFLLEREINSFKENEVYFDSGCGQANVLKDLIADPQFVGKVFGIALHQEPQWISESKEKFSNRLYFIQSSIENLRSEKIIHTLGQKIRLITDSYGPVSYTFDLTSVLQFYVDVMELNSKTFLFSPHVFIVTKAGYIVSLEKWLREVSGIKIDSIVDAVFSFQKKANNVKIPKLNLINFSLKHGLPGIHVYQEI